MSVESILSSYFRPESEYYSKYSHYFQEYSTSQCQLIKTLELPDVEKQLLI